MHCHPTVEVAVEEREHATGEEPEQEPILIPAGIIISPLLLFFEHICINALQV